jgi:hypothetical protein
MKMVFTTVFKTQNVVMLHFPPDFPHCFFSSKNSIPYEKMLRKGLSIGISHAMRASTRVSPPLAAVKFYFKQTRAFAS